MKIIQSPCIERETVEIGIDYPSLLTRVLFRVPDEPARTVRIPGRIQYTTGFLVIESGDYLAIGEKLQEPVIDDITGATLHGLRPVHQCKVTGKVAFVVDHIEYKRKASNAN